VVVRCGVTYGGTLWLQWVLNAVECQLLTTVGTRFNTIKDQLWKTVDEAITLQDCVIYRYTTTTLLELIVVRVVPDLTISKLAGAGPGRRRCKAGFVENLFWSHRTICLMKLWTSTMLSTAIKQPVQFSVSFVASMFARF